MYSARAKKHVHLLFGLLLVLLFDIQDASAGGSIAHLESVLRKSNYSFHNAVFPNVCPCPSVIFIR